MNQTRCIVILSILALFVASVSVAGNISLPDASQKVFEGKPCINSPRAIGNYPASPFLFYIPTTGQRPMEWSAEKLPKGLKLDSKTGIITGSVASKGEYTVTLKAKNALGTSTEKLVIRIGDDLLLTPPMGWNSWNTFGRHLTEELVLQTADALVANGMRDLGYSYINIDDFWQLPERGADGHLQINKDKFPRGIKYVADYLHERGFKLGIYSDAADKTCGGVCGSYGYCFRTDLSCSRITDCQNIIKQYILGSKQSFLIKALYHQVVITGMYHGMCDRTINRRIKINAVRISPVLIRTVIEYLYILQMDISGTINPRIPKGRITKHNTIN